MSKKRILDISEETYELIKSQLKEEEKLDINSLKDLEGKNMFFRTVTYHILGKVEKVIGNFIQLSSASWIADSKRFSNFIKEGVIVQAEIEPIGEWFVNINSCTDFGEWKFTLPLKQQ